MYICIYTPVAAPNAPAVAGAPKAPPRGAPTAPPTHLCVCVVCVCMYRSACVCGGGSA